MITPCAKKTRWRSRRLGQRTTDNPISPFSSAWRRVFAERTQHRRWKDFQILQHDHHVVFQGAFVVPQRLAIFTLLPHVRDCRAVLENIKLGRILRPGSSHLATADEKMKMKKWKNEKMKKKKGNRIQKTGCKVDKTVLNFVIQWLRSFISSFLPKCKNNFSWWLKLSVYLHPCPWFNMSAPFHLIRYNVLHGCAEHTGVRNTRVCGTNKIPRSLIFNLIFDKPPPHTNYIVI